MLARRKFLLACAALLVPPRAHAADIITVHLFGDSMFSDAADASLAHRSVAGIANMALSGSHPPARLQFSHAAIGHDGAAGAVRSVARSRNARIVFADAGPHGCDPDVYQREWESLAFATRGVPFVMMDMFDYPPAPLNCQYGHVFGSRTMNDATRRAFNNAIAAGLDGTWIDLRSKMNRWRSRLLDKGIAAISDDGIHPTTLGKVLMAGEILRALGFTTTDLVAKLQQAWCTEIACNSRSGPRGSSPSWHQIREDVYECVPLPK